MDASVASPVHTTKDAHYKDHTIQLPNTAIFGMNASTNKCTSVVQGRPKTIDKSTLSTTFPAKNGEINSKEPNRPENHQYLNSEFIYIQINKSQTSQFQLDNE